MSFLAAPTQPLLPSADLCNGVKRPLYCPFPVTSADAGLDQIWYAVGYV
jgi:hypothetical protein